MKSESGRPFGDYGALFGLKSLRARLQILYRSWLNHRFERRSPLALLDAVMLDRIHSHEVTFPPRSALLQAGGQTIEGIFFLVSLAHRLQSRLVFEIGTYQGVTTWCLARNLSCEVHTLDIPDGAAPALPTEQSDEHRASAASLLYDKLGPYEGAIMQHWGDSATFDFEPWTKACDLVYIDAGHSEEYVRSDTANALKMVSDSGAIVWDDYWRLSPGVTTVLDELAAELPLFRVPATRLVVHLSAGARSALKDHHRLGR